jgi:sec-independent protein translocase protein TatC
MADPVDTYRMPLLEHLRELRGRLITCLYTLFFTVTVSFFFANDIFAWLAAPMNDALHTTGHGTMAVTQAMEGFMVQMKVAGLTGVFVASPVLFWQVWKFVGPGLYEQEKRAVLPLVIASTGLFTAGAAFAYYGVFRFGFPIFLQMNGENVTAVLSIESYLGFVTTLLVSFGASFQLPIVIYFLARMGLVDHIDLIKGFRYSVVLIFVIAAVLTPPDVMSQMLMAGPLLVLYGIGIVVARLVSTKKRAIPAA